MSYTDRKITQEEINAHHVQGATDYLIGNPQQNKAVFDNLPEFIAGKFNDLIDEIAGQHGDEIKVAVDEWLAEHPEVTTTVQDNSLTTAKYVDGSVTEPKIAERAVTPSKLDRAYSTPADLASVNANLTNELNVLDARMDEFASLPEGSTSGNAELLDIRVGADGETYQSAGGAVRGQVAGLKSDFLDVAEIVVSPNLLNFNDADFETGKYMAQDGTKYSSGTYNLSGYIPVEEGETYTYAYGLPVGSSKTMRFITAFDSSKNVISSEGKESQRTYTVPSGVAFIRFSAEAQYFNPNAVKIMFYKGTSIDQYYEYWTPYYVIKDNALDADYLNSLINAKIADCATDYGLATKATADSMTSADTLTVVQNIDNKKNAVIGFYAEFDSFSSVTVGHGFNINYGNKAVIDDTYITVYYGSAQQQVSHVAHGLTISDFICVTITQNNGARAKIHIVTATGDYTLSDCSWDGCRGDVFAKTGGNLTGCVLTAVFKDFNEKLFLFGDSYVSMGDTSRYPYYLIQQGYTHLLIDGWGGRNSAQALTSFNNVMSKAVPKCAVWALGMNDADASSAVNASWLSCVQSFISTCEQNGVTPILSTIPNCPTQLNTFKNDWVRNSGYRYIDFAKAVGAESSGSAWYTGMLSTDNVHPTALGAKALYARFITDVPEVIK